MGATAAATPGASGRAPSKVPSLILSEVAKIRAALHQRGSTSLSSPQARRISAGVLPMRVDGGIGVQLHALGAVGAAQLHQLARLGVDVRASSADYARVPGIAFPQAGLVQATVPYDKIDAVAALPWVAALRPTIKPAVDVGPITAEGVQLHNADGAQAAGFSGAGQKVGVISDDVDHLADSQAQGELPDDGAGARECPL